MQRLKDADDVGAMLIADWTTGAFASTFSTAVAIQSTTGYRPVGGHGRPVQLMYALARANSFVMPDAIPDELRLPAPARGTRASGLEANGFTTAANQSTEQLQ